MLPDDHDLTTRLFLNALREHVDVRGVVHVGAHRGQEVAHYQRAGISQIVLIEPNPSNYAYLEAEFGKNSDITVLPYAITDFDGHVEMNVNHSRTGNDESSSILRLKRLAEIVPTVQTVETVRVASRRLDTLYDSSALRGCNFLNIDIQGAELQALRGARAFLRDVDAILIETNLIEMYEGCALEPQIEDELNSLGFDCVERVYHELYDAAGRFPAWGECLYVRAREPVN
ncbi:MAG TPA: FkbM family methyltransferase [Candidatus Baltobacteraceae bacterium]|nr:FkbM family methyltransferase [Candidatus Baltobacteraceae bacterium]